MNKELTQSHAKQFQKSPLKVEDNFEGFGDPYYISGKDSARVYKDISYNAFKQNGFRDIRGWIPLMEANKTSELIPNSEEYGVKGDGLFHRGDAIIAFMPRERFVAMRQRVLGQVRSQEDSALKGGEAANLGKQLRVNGKTNLTIEGD